MKASCPQPAAAVLRSGTQEIIGCSSFAEALAVPLFAEACIQALQAHSSQYSRELGTGIKVLRSVCRGTRQVMKRMIKGFVFKLENGRGACEPGLVKLLQSVSLLNLDVKFVTNIIAGEKSNENIQARLVRMPFA